MYSPSSFIHSLSFLSVVSDNYSVGNNIIFRDIVLSKGWRKDHSMFISVSEVSFGLNPSLAIAVQWLLILCLCLYF